MRTKLIARQWLALLTLCGVLLAGPVTPGAAHRQGHRHRHPAHHKSAGPPPVVCLKGAGLVHVRQESSGVWEANTPGSQLDDHNSTVFVDGPYGSNSAAQQSAQSLQGVEYAVAGGIWVAQTTVRSNLDATVDRVARCLAAARTTGPGSTRG